jgi:hypothetical protein
LWVALSAAFEIGHFAFRNPTTERIKRDGQRARKVSFKAKSREIDEVILRHAEPFLAAEKPAPPKKIVFEIVTPVNVELDRKRLPAQGASGIVKRLYKLKKLRRV